MPDDAHSFVQSFVVVDFDSDEVTDFFSFYKVQSSENEPTCCRELFSVAKKNAPLAIMKLNLAKAMEEGYKTFLTTDLMDNYCVFEKLGFKPDHQCGNQNLYSYNYCIPVNLLPNSVAWSPIW
jgi:hypothetical protein